MFRKKSKALKESIRQLNIKEFGKVVLKGTISEEIASIDKAEERGSSLLITVRGGCP